jgi:hypothetical protein
VASECQELYINALALTDRDCHNERLLMPDRLGTEGSNRGDPEAEAEMGEVGHAARVCLLNSTVPSRGLWCGCRVFHRNLLGIPQLTLPYSRLIENRRRLRNVCGTTCDLRTHAGYDDGP